MDSRQSAALRLLRLYALQLGYEWDDVSDQELLEGLQQIAELYRRSGLMDRLKFAGCSKVGPRFENLFAGVR